jgi:two-component system cell cycle response regulator DivK
MTRRILIAEDDDDLRNILSHILISGGYEIQAVMDGQQALDALEAGRFDLMLIDLAMPKVDGWTVIRQLRMRAETRTTPVIALSAHDFAQDQAAAFKAGCNKFLAKPFDPYLLLEEVQKLLGAYTNNSSSNSTV